MSKYGEFSGPCFAAFRLNPGKYGLEKTPYLDIFHAVTMSSANGPLAKLSPAFLHSGCILDYVIYGNAYIM